MRLSQELSFLAAVLATSVAAVPKNLFARDSDTGNCGIANDGKNGGLSCGTVGVNLCCSPAGWCGDTTDHCGAGCQKDYGKCNDVVTSTPAPSTPGTGTPVGSRPSSNPAGGTTANIPRPILGSVPYGADIYECTVPGTVALTFDDGPYIYTTTVLDLLKEFGAKATFFITWDHKDLSTLSEGDRRDQMYKLEMGMRNILGKFPTYMRPPYSSCNGDCVNTMGALGYHIIYFDLDTDDYNNDSPELIVNARNNFKKAIDGTNAAERDFLAIAHDIHDQTANNLTRYMLQTLKDAGYRAVTVGECRGDPAANWYRPAS